MTSDRVLGILGGGMVIAAVVLLVVGGAGDEGAAARSGSPEPPRIQQIAPEEGALIDGPVEVVFRVREEMERLPGGWGIGDHHLHLEMDGVELMPAAEDIERVGEGEYRWIVGAAEPGPHALRLLWSGPDHRPLPGTATPLVRVEVR